MNLVIDIGNSAIKLAVFKGDECIDTFHSGLPDRETIQKLRTQHGGIERCILSSVRKEDPELSAMLDGSFSTFLKLDHNTPLPIRNLYRSTSTLGYDRIAAAVGAGALFPGKNVLIIDTGTAITIDLLTADDSYLGGNISPGVSMRFRALHEFTENLPMVDAAWPAGEMGRDTTEAIRSGVLNGIVFELDGYITRQKTRYPDLKVVMTGGDAEIFDKRLKNSIFVDSNLNLYGLHRILEYNAEG